MGCNCKCKCGDEETTETAATTTVVGKAPIVSNVSQQRGTVGESATVQGHTAGQVIHESKPAKKWWKFWAEEEETFNSLWVGDDHKITISGGKQKFRKRKNEGQESGNQTPVSPPTTLRGARRKNLSDRPAKAAGDHFQENAPVAPPTFLQQLTQLFSPKKGKHAKLEGCGCRTCPCPDTVSGPSRDSGVANVFESRAENKLTVAQKITDLADWFNYPQREQFLFNSEINEPMNGSSNSVDHINPVEVQGSEDIMGAEEVIWPQFTQNISGQGRTFANTIHPGMVIPNPDNYPTPEGNSPWAPYVNIRTYGDILDAVYPPYPSAMEWARNPQNYKEYPSTDWYTP